MSETRVDIHGDLAVVAPAGDVDPMATAKLRAALIRVLYQVGVPRIVVDLSRADLLDSSGIGVLAAAYRAGLRRGITVRVINAGPLVRSVLEVAGLYEALTAPPGTAAPPNAARHFVPYDRRANAPVANARSSVA